MSRDPQVRNVVFTLNAQEGEDLLLLDMDHPTWTNVKYVIYQREMGSHEHFQGYIEFSQPKTYASIHAMEGLERARFDKRRGTAKQASHYCQKPVDNCFCSHCEDERTHPTKLEGPWSAGEMSQQGVRADLLEVKRAIDSGVSLKRIAQDPDLFCTWVKMPKNFETYKRISTVERDEPPMVFCFVGLPASGKTRTAYNLARKIGSVYSVPPKNGIFYCDDYNQEECFIIDEMDGHRMTPQFFNQLCDRYPMCVPSHGSAGHQFTSKYIFITSNYHPKYWWKRRAHKDWQQTLRRINVLIYFPKYEKPAPRPQACPHCAAAQICAFHHL